MSRSPSIQALTGVALHAFWRIVAEQYPRAETGDLSIERSIALHASARAAVTEWVRSHAEEAGGEGVV